MQRLVLLTLMIAGLSSSCSKGLRSGADAGRDSGAHACADQPPENCGYVCQNGVWVATAESCDSPDSAVAGQPDAMAKDGAATDTVGTVATGGASGSGGAPATGGVTGEGGATAGGGASVTGGSRAVYDAGAPVQCVDISGMWRVTGSCRGPRATFDGSFFAVIAQTGCDVIFTQSDDNTSTQWIATGRMESTGRAYVKGDFGFTDSSMCDITVAAEGWDMMCGSATQQCLLKAVRAAP